MDPFDPASQGQAPQPPPSSPAPAGGMSKNEQNMGMLCHLLGLIGFVGPLIIWLIKHQEMPFVESEGKESLNFQISMLIYYLAASILCFVFIGFLILPLLFVFNLIIVIIAAMQASDGKSYRYPLCIRFLK